MNDHRRDIEDNYESYLDDELGYAWGVWDRTTLANIARHDDILHAVSDDIAALDPAGLDDLQRLALARACRRHDDPEGELDSLRLIVSDSMEHPGVNYVEVVDRTVARLCGALLFDEAEVIIERLEAQEWCAQPQLYMRALVRLASETSMGRDAFEELLIDAPDDPELRFDVAEDLIRFGRMDDANELLDDAEQVANRTGNKAVLVDIELLRAGIGAKKSATTG
jgi:hypothetical protein